MTDSVGRNGGPNHLGEEEFQITRRLGCSIGSFFIICSLFVSFWFSYVEWSGGTGLHPLSGMLVIERWESGIVEITKDDQIASQTEMGARTLDVLLYLDAYGDEAADRTRTVISQIATYYPDATSAKLDFNRFPPPISEGEVEMESVAKDVLERIRPTKPFDEYKMQCSYRTFEQYGVMETNNVCSLRFRYENYNAQVGIRYQPGEDFRLEKFVQIVNTVSANVLERIAEDVSE